MAKLFKFQAPPCRCVIILLGNKKQKIIKMFVSNFKNKKIFFSSIVLVFFFSIYLTRILFDYMLVKCSCRSCHVDDRQINWFWIILFISQFNYRIILALVEYAIPCRLLKYKCIIYKLIYWAESRLRYMKIIIIFNK